MTMRARQWPSAVQGRMIERSAQKRQAWLPAIASLALLAGLDPAAALPESGIRFVPDVASSFRGVRYSHGEVVSAGTMASGSLIPAFSSRLPRRVGVDALIVHGDTIIFSSDVDFTVDGVSYADEDLIQFSVPSNTFASFFDGAAHGIPGAADLDAASMESGTTNLLLSFDSAVVLPGLGRVSDGDVIRFVSNQFQLAYSGSSHLGIPDAADLTSLHDDATNLYFTLDVTAVVQGEMGSDEAVWAFNKITGEIAVTPSTIGASTEVMALDVPLDSDRDWLTDFEEMTGLDEAASTFPGTNKPLSPEGNTSDPHVADSDGDRAPDGQEAAAGSDPLDGTDSLRFVGQVLSGADLVLSWRSVPGRTYGLYWTDTLGSDFQQPIATSIPANAGTNVTAVAVPSDSGRIYFRVQLVP